MGNEKETEVLETTLIRKMKPEDWNEVKEIYWQGMQSGVATFQNELPSYESWDAGHLADPRFVAIDQNRKVLGFIVLSPTSSRPCYRGVCEVSIYIGETARGKKIGTALMQKMIEASEHAGIWLLYSSLFDNNVASIALHRKCGFREIGYREHIAKEPLTGVWRSTILFERRSKRAEFN